MACCALAAFLISQILFALDWAREALGLGQPAGATAHGAALWRLGEPAPPAPATRRLPRFGVALAGGGLAFVVLAGVTLRAQADPGRWAAFDLICTAHGLQPAASVLGRN